MIKLYLIRNSVPFVEIDNYINNDNELADIERVIKMNSIIKNVNGINITVDYRTELLGIIMLISDYHKKFPILFDDFDNNRFYVDRIKSQFDKYKDDEVVKDFIKLVDRHSFNYDAPFSLFLQLDDNFKTDKLDDYVFKDRLQSDNNIFDFIKKLNGFAEKVEFDEFYNGNKELYESWITNISSAFEKYNITDFFKKYYGYSNEKDFTINLTAFTTNGAYCCDLDDKIVSCYPVFKEMKEDKLFDCKGIEKYLVQTSVHEFSHGYVNPITEKYNILNEDTNFFDDIKEDMEKQAYPYDSQIINEHIIRGIEARYVYHIHGDDKWYKNRIQNDKNLGFIYLDSIIDSLIYYENNRDTYKTFDDFYPVIIDNLQEYKNNKGKQR